MFVSCCESGTPSAATMESVWYYRLYFALLSCCCLLVVSGTADADAEAGPKGDANSYIENAKKLPVPEFLPTNPNFYHHVGDTAVLECAVENLGRKKVSWRKVSGGQILTVGLVSFVDDERIEVEHPPGSSQWNLVIRDLQAGDAGVYECQISSKIRHLRHHVTLLVQNEPKAPKLKEPNIQITGADFVDEGEKIELLCNATAKDQPPEDLDWFREGNRLQTSEHKGVYIRKFVTLATGTIVSILEIKHAQLSDAGVYVCRTSSLDVTSFRVNVLNGDTYNVKRGTEMDQTDETAHDSAASQETRHSTCSAILLASAVALVFHRLPWHIT
ncbi:zwei Ig domain protein zig-8-like [Babylonia areolata]|uniref:zwei Ig domain protein zig-8-like n=1 Tax=Babylonia areolata TaxID=304850 RepID=UPI003FD01929